MNFIKFKTKYVGMGSFEFRTKCPYKQKDSDGDTIRVGYPNTCHKCKFYHGQETHSKSYVRCSYGEEDDKD